MRSIAFALLVACIAATPMDNTTDRSPRSPEARDALDRLASEKSKAKKACDDAISKATLDALSTLQKSKGDVMKAGNLDEANRIQAAIDRLAASTLTSPKKASVTGQYLYNGRLIVDSVVVLRSDGTIFGDGHEWKMKWQMDPDGYLELSEKGSTFVLAQTPSGWAGCNAGNVPLALTRK